jgi:polysaccharide export outer membrane protein
MKLRLLCGISLLWCAAAQAQTAVPPPPPEGALAVAPAKVVEIDLAKAAQPEPLKLDVDDQVRLVVLGHPELTTVARVQPDGRAAFPVVGDLPVRGLTLQQALGDIQQRLAATAKPAALSLRPGDEVQLTVWHHVELTHTAIVQDDGVIAVPLIGEVQAQGRSLADLRGEITKRMAAYIREPQVSVLPTRIRRPGSLSNAEVSLLLERQRERHVAVLGEVLVQGLQPVTPGLRVLDALAQARYNMNNADLDSVVVIRNVNGTVPEYKLLKLAKYINGEQLQTDENLLLRADDVVIVPKTTITKVGDFIDRFFTRTKPVFDWWISLQQARYAEDISRNTVRLYQSLLP